MELFLLKKMKLEKNHKQTCNKHKLAYASSVNECDKIDTLSRAEKTEHMGSRQNVPAGRSKMASKPWNRMKYRTVTLSSTVHEQ